MSDISENVYITLAGLAALSNPEKVLFTSDTHFGHTNIIKYCNRPFKDVIHMNEEMIRLWNKKVPEDGIVFLVGDFFMGQEKYWKSTRKRLNGYIYLIAGNHDRVKKLQYNECIDAVADELYLEFNKIKYWLAHHPVGYTERPKAKEEYDFALCGHIHQNWHRVGNCINVGVDVNNYVPITLTELEEQCKTLPDEVSKTSIVAERHL